MSCNYSELICYSDIKDKQMKKLAVVTILFCVANFTFAQVSSFDTKMLQKTLMKINESLYASKYEVTNKEYIAFLDFLKENKKGDKYLLAQIDTAMWGSELAYNEPYIQHYHTHLAYENYPVVNVDYDGATLFCEWLTEQYNSNDKRKFEKVEFRLPSESEWIEAARGGNPVADYPWKGKSLKTNKGLYRCNFMRLKKDFTEDAAKRNNNADVTAPSKSYWPNKYGLYNMSGNVAEMLAEKGSTKGGSWKDTEEAMKIDGDGKFAKFEKPMPTIGFRYFMVVIEK